MMPPHPSSFDVRHSKFELSAGLPGRRAKGRRPRVTLLYHYFHPDDVVSARHFTELGTGLVERGWRVEALPCNRGCRDETLSYPLEEEWEQINIRRIWRPRFRQATGLGKVLNAAWMLSAWCLATAARPQESARRAAHRRRPAV